MARDFTDADTTVFWDVEDFPVDKLDELGSKIEAALEKIGYHGEVSIRAYGEREPDEVVDRYKDAKITFLSRGDKQKRVDRMLLDICFWMVDHPQPDLKGRMLKGKPTNLMVISKFIPGDTVFAEILENTSTADFNVLLVLPCNCDPVETPVPEVQTAWFWESLLDGGEALSPDDLASLIARGGQWPAFLAGHVDHDPCPQCEENKCVRNVEFCEELITGNDDPCWS